MDQSLIFWPMIAQVGLVFLIYLELGRRRFIAAKARKITYDDFKIVRSGNEPEFSAKAARNIINNFELPVLFHSVVLALYLTNLVTFPQLVVAWVFVGSRYVHSLVHLTQNNVAHRGFWFIFGFVALALMWALFAITLATG